MEDLEASLQKLGREWRAGQAPFDAPDISLAQRAPMASLRWRWSPLALVAVTAIVVLAFATGRLAPNPSVGGLQDGASVVGSGFLIENASGQTSLCIGGSDRVSDSPVCSVVAVPVDGVDWQAVPGAVKGTVGWYAGGVTVRGSWTGSAVDVQSVAANANAAFKPPTNPCSADEGDGAGLGTPAEEQALGVLSAEVFGNPDGYAGLWRAGSADGLGRVVVEVVGDRDQAETKLRGLYPFPLCIVPAQFSDTELQATLHVVGESTPQWVAYVDYPTNRVIVSVAILTEAEHSQLQPVVDRIAVKQLLHPA